MPRTYYPVGHPKHKVDTRKRPGRKDYRKPGTRNRQKEQKFHSSDFIAWDGEGMNVVKGKHIYCLLMNSLGDKAISLSTSGLHTVQCFELLLEYARKNPKAIHVCFGASYDVNMMLKDIPLDLLRKLHAGQRIIWHVSPILSYSLQYRPRKSFFLGRFVDGRHFTKKEHTDGSITYEAKYDAKMILWDVFGFFQGSFLSALEKYFTEEERQELGYEKIKAGKERRSAFKPAELKQFVIPYTFLEVTALVALMERLRNYLKEANLTLQRWDGAGAIAAAILKREKIRRYYGLIPQEVNTASLHAYGGGRIEAVMYGSYHGPIYHYDINSAYPSAMLELPDLSKGIWTYYDTSSGAQGVQANATLYPFALFKVSWRFPVMPFYPFFVRGKDKAIDYPQAGLNWMWRSELDAAIATIPDCWKYIHIHEAYSFLANSWVKPFSFVQDLYKQRQVWKAQGQGAEKVLKLGINSLYGKTVQHLGYDEKSGRKPPYYQIQYGGMITSETRAKLFKAGMQYPESIIAFSTDGIWSLFPLDLPVGDNLGEWSFEELTGLTLVQSGVYWMDVHCTKHPTTQELKEGRYYQKNGEWYQEKQYYRGFDKDHLTRTRVREAWQSGVTTLSVPTTRFVTLGSALASEDRFLAKWRTWDALGENGEGRKLKLTAEGTKRIEPPFKGSRQGHPIWGKHMNPSKDLIRTVARSNPHITKEYAEIFPYPDACMSVKAEQPWERDERGLEEQKLEEILDQEVQQSEY